MRINLSAQLFILIFIIIVFALGTNSYINYKSFEKDYLKEAYVGSEKDLQVVIQNILSSRDKLKSKINNISENEIVINSLNLISNYQDKNKYDEVLFNAEKTLLLKEVQSRLNEDALNSFYIFDYKKNLTAFSNINEQGIITYKNGEELTLQNNKLSKNKIDFDIEKLKNNNEPFLVLKEKTFSICIVEQIYLEDELVGFILADKTFSKNNIHELFTNLRFKLSFLINDTLLGSLQEVDISYFSDILTHREEESTHEELYDDANYFYHTHTFQVMKGDALSFISAIDKKSLEKKIDEITELLLLSVLISLTISIFFAFAFLNTHVLKPLKELLFGINRLRKGDFTPIKVSSSNEFLEIADDFNLLGSKLERSFSKVEQVNRFLENIIDTVPIRVFWKDINGYFLGANKLFINDIGLSSKSELIGKNDFDLTWTDEETRKYIMDDKDVITNDKSLLLIEGTHTFKDGKVIHTLSSKVPLKDASGSIVGVLGVYDDVTMVKQIESDLEEKDLILFEQSKLAAMGEMLENIAHQWRQPLSVITTSATGVMLKKEMDILDDDILISSLDAINKSAQHLSQTIEDFRNFYKADRAMKFFNIEKTNKKALELLAPRLKNKEITIISKVDSFELKGYENELIQVFINILNNAIDQLKKVEEGNKYIFISTHVENNRLLISFRDNARGIPKELMDKVFEHKFTTKDEKSGTGLGLYMSKLIIEKIDGIIAVENISYEHENRTYTGAQFIISLPVK